MNTDTQANGISLGDYFDSIAGRDVSAADFLKNALCYDETKAYFDNNPGIVTLLYGASAEERITIVNEVITAIRRGYPPRGGENLNQFKPGAEQLANSRPRALSPKEVADVVELTGSTIQSRQQDKVKKLKIDEKVAAFAQNLRQKQRDELLKSLSDPATSENPTEVKEEYLKSIDRSDSPDKHELKTVAEELFTKTSLHVYAAAEVKKTNDVVRVILQNATDSPKIFTENFLKKIVEAEDVTPSAIAGAERFARIATVINTPINAEGLSLRAFLPDEKVTAALERAVENFSFLQSWGDARDQIIQSAVLSDRYKDLIRSGDTLVTRLSGEKVLHGAENLVSEIFKAPPDQDVLDYFEALRSSGKISMSANEFRELRKTGELVKKTFTASLRRGTIAHQAAPHRGAGQDMLHYLEALHSSGSSIINIHQFFTGRLFAEQPTFFHFSLNTSPFDWVLQFGKKGAVKTAGAATGAELKTGGSAAAKRVVAAALTKLFPSLAAETIEAISGPVGWIVFAVTTVLPWIWKGVKKIIAPIIALLGSANSGVAGALRSGFNLPAAPQSWADKKTIWIILISALALPMIATASMMTNTVSSFPTNDTGEFTGLEEPVGPIIYTGPQPSGPLQCLNFNVSPTTFSDVQAVPLTPAQGGVINNALNAYPQLGLYNCLLNCPANKTNIYSGGASNWWGWAANSKSVVLYNGFFASGSTHLQARLIAHELAHILAANSPGVFSAFMNGTTESPRGYCGCLGTYPSGKAQKPCSPLETPGETFAEAAAMFLTGESLQSLCPSAYNFMSVLFNQCAK